MRLRAAVIVGGALCWVVAYWINDLFFSQTLEALGAHWIFLPAALRLVVVVVFRTEGAASIVVGNFLSSLLFRDYDSMALLVATSLESGLAPLLALYLLQRYGGLRTDLSNLNPNYLILLTVSASVLNAVFKVAAFGTLGSLGPAHFWAVGVALFAGDAVGILFVTGVCSLLFRAWAAWRERPMIEPRI